MSQTITFAGNVTLLMDVAVRRCELRGTLARLMPHAMAHHREDAHYFVTNRPIQYWTDAQERDVVTLIASIRRTL